MVLPHASSSWAALTLPVVFGFWNFIIPAVASLLSNMATGRAQGRQAQAQNNAQQDQIRTTQYGTAQQAALQAAQGAERANMDRALLGLDQRKFALTAPQTRAGTAVRGDFLSRGQDASYTQAPGKVPVLHGGMKPSMFSNETRQLGQAMTRDALAQQLKGDTFDEVPQQDWQGARLPTPGVTAQPTPSGFDKFLSIAAPIAGVAGAVGDAQTGDKIQQLLDELKNARTPGVIPQPMGQSVGVPYIPPPPYNIDEYGRVS